MPLQKLRPTIECKSYTTKPNDFLAFEHGKDEYYCSMRQAQKVSFTMKRTQAQKKVVNKKLKFTI